MSGDRSKIVERIRKLLALADDKGATEAEAVAAVMMAQCLMAENDVADWELHSMDEQPIATAESEPVRRRWRWTLADAISSNFRCRYYQNRKRCAPTGWKTEYRMIFYGYESDAKAAALAFDYLYKIGDRLGCRQAGKAYREHGYSDGAYNGFVLGFVAGVRSELEKQSQALLIVVPPKVNESYEAFSVDFGKAKTDVSVARTSFSLGAYESGLKEGRDAVRSRRMDAPDEDGDGMRAVALLTE